MPRDVAPARKITGHLTALLVATGRGFETAPVAAGELDLDGFALSEGRERHQGAVRKADARVPWYPRGTPIRNSRQVSIVSTTELAAIAAALEVPRVEAAWLGTNLVLDGVPDVSMLPRGTRLHLPGGAAIVVEDQNVPCRGPGRAIAAQYPGRDDIEFTFVKVAKRLRGLVGFVERAGPIRTGDAIELRLPEQWIY